MFAPTASLTDLIFYIIFVLSKMISLSSCKPSPGWKQTRTAQVLAGTPSGEMDSIRRWRLLDEQKLGIVHGAFGLAGVCDL
jgi:hypothetical protein